MHRIFFLIGCVKSSAASKMCVGKIIESCFCQDPVAETSLGYRNAETTVFNSALKLNENQG